MLTEKVVISVPGSSANLGPGFDSIGLAVNRYLTITVTPAEKWTFHIDESKELEGITGDVEDNLIYQVATHIAGEYGKELPPCDVAMESTIPLSRGLGSSAAAIIAGIELANQVLGLQLTDDEKLRHSSLWEGHPDNVSASLFGGLVIGSHREDATDVIRGGVPEIDIVMMVPQQELKTKKARGVLPETISFKEAVKGSSISNVLTAAILQGNWELAGKMMVEDIFHQPYRFELVPGLEKALKEVRDLGAYGVALSGAGPTVICFTAIGQGESLREKLAERFPEFSFQIVKPDSNGVTVSKVTIEANV
ncbi:homoserine kinase [Anaerobacillus sp. MEB173]|uniref:homoserine kinase n=1 Tax=Anaerobacillus sp. MEB173 TaxID=3383345 RepID=UPI003F8FCF4E